MHGSGACQLTVSTQRQDKSAQNYIICYGLKLVQDFHLNLASSASLTCYNAGISVNMSAFAATFLAEAANDPRILLPYSHMGDKQELVSSVQKVV